MRTAGLANVAGFRLRYWSFPNGRPLAIHKPMRLAARRSWSLARPREKTFNNGRRTYQRNSSVIPRWIATQAVPSKCHQRGAPRGGFLKRIKSVRNGVRIKVATNEHVIPSRTVVPNEKSTGCRAKASTAKPRVVVRAEISTEADVAERRGGRPRHSSNLLVTRKML